MPGHIVPLPELPRTRNGKLDRAALPAPDVAGGAHVAPRTEAEELVAQIFGEVLGVPPCGGHRRLLRPRGALRCSPPAWWRASAGPSTWSSRCAPCSPAVRSPSSRPRSTRSWRRPSAHARRPEHPFRGGRCGAGGFPAGRVPGRARPPRRRLRTPGRPRVAPPDEGRSINLGLSARGIGALRRAGLWDSVRAHTVPMRGRYVHPKEGRPFFHPYGRDPGQILYSIRRDALSRTLVEHAEKLEGVRFFFETPVTDIDRDGPSFRAGSETITPDVIVGADGAFSAVRSELLRGRPADFRQEFLPWGLQGAAPAVHRTARSAARLARRTGPHGRPPQHRRVADLHAVHGPRRPASGPTWRPTSGACSRPPTCRICRGSWPAARSATW